jgi:Flp pilus assembly protein TadD
VSLPNAATGGTDRCLEVADTPPDLSPVAHAETLSMLERCVARHPADVELMSDLGAVYASSGRFVDAEAVYRRLLSVDPGDADVRVRLGRLLVSRGDLAGARVQGEAALAIQPNRQAVLDLIRDATPQ